MERHFGLPIAFAAALHGAVLFGVSKSPRKPAPPVEREPTRLFRMVPPPEEEVVPVEATEASSERRSLPDTPTPVRGPEPEIEVTTGFKIPVPTIASGPMVNGPIVPPEVPGIRRGGSDGPWGTPIGREFLDNTPRTRFQAAPVYPYTAKRDGVSGEVMVEFVVDETGGVIDPRVVRSSNPMFEEASLRAVAKWKFEPGKRNGRVVRFRMTVPVVFTLSE